MNKRKQEDNVTQAEIAQGLRDLGLEPGVGVMVHSALSSFGRVEGGAAAVIAALMEVLKPEGTLLMPSFNHGAPFVRNGPGFFAPHLTPTTNGAIPDAFWRMPDVHRSLNPTHAFAAWGQHAQRYVELHHRTLTMGPQSPLGQLLADDGYCLLLGVDYRANSFHHVVEMSTGAPCLGLRTEAYPIALPEGHEVGGIEREALPDSSRVMGRTWGWRARPCPLTDRNRYADLMEAVHRRATIGASIVTLYRLQDGYDVVAEVLANGRDGFPPCSGCPIRPRRVVATAPSDWDAENECVYPWSEALNY